jgi:hypothetical protein
MVVETDFPRPEFEPALGDTTTQQSNERFQPCSPGDENRCWRPAKLQMTGALQVCQPSRVVCGEKGPRIPFQKEMVRARSSV